MSKKNRKTRALRVENLENRELMAADVVTATLSNGNLQINGTNNSEYVRVNQLGQNITVSVGFARSFAAFPASAVRSLQMNMNAGNDKVEVNLQQRTLDSIFVDMGLGSNERVDLDFGNVNSLTVNSVGSLGTSAFLRGTVNGRASIDFGSDPANDSLNINRSYIRNLNVNMGGGNDYCQLNGTRVDQAMINLGSGDDTFSNAWGSEVTSGTIDGGSAVRGNRWVGNRFGRGVTVRGL